MEHHILGLLTDFARLCLLAYERAHRGLLATHAESTSRSRFNVSLCNNLNTEYRIRVESCLNGACDNEPAN